MDKQMEQEVIKIIKSFYKKYDINDVECSFSGDTISININLINIKYSREFCLRNYFFQFDIILATLENDLLKIKERIRNNNLDELL